MTLGLPFKGTETQTKHLIIFRIGGITPLFLLKSNLP